MPTLPNLSNGVRANFPGAMNTSTPATIKPLTPFQTLPQTGQNNSATMNSLLTAPATSGQTKQVKSASVVTPPATPVPSGNPTMKAPDDPSNKYNTSTGQLNPNYSGAPATNASGVQYWTSPTGQVIDMTTGKPIGIDQSSAPSQITPGSGYVVDPNNRNGVISANPEAPTPQTTGYQTGPNSAGSPDTQDMSYQGLIQQLLQKGGQTTSDIKALQDQLSGALGQNANRAIPLEFQTGRAQTLQSIESQRESALQQQLANTKGLLGTAISATAPQAGAAFFGNPITGQVVGGGGIGAAGDIQGRLQMATALAPKSAALTVVNSALGNVQSMFSQFPDLNSSNFTDLNALKQFLATKTGDPRYQQLNTSIDTMLQKAAQVMGTDVNTLLVNSRASGGNVLDSLKNIAAMAQNTYNAESNKVNGTTLPTTATPTFSNATGAGGSTTSGSNPFDSKNFFG